MCGVGTREISWVPLRNPPRTARGPKKGPVARTMGAGFSLCGAGRGEFYENLLTPIKSYLPIAKCDVIVG